MEKFITQINYKILLIILGFISAVIGILASIYKIRESRYKIKEAKRNLNKDTMPKTPTSNHIDNSIIKYSNITSKEELKELKGNIPKADYKYLKKKLSD